MTVEIVCADAREALAAMPGGSVHTCVTSPPYWGLRDYGLESAVWGGDDGCEHEWGDESYQRRSSDTIHVADAKQLTNVGSRNRDEPIHHATCRRCNAWRGTLGLEPTPEIYVEHIVQVMREVRRVLRDDGTLWLNLGDSYASNPAKGGSGTPNGRNNRGEGYARPLRRGSKRADGIVPEDSPRNRDGTPCPPGLKPKDLCGMPWRVAFALQSDGWWLRRDVIWSKPNPMPESTQDRPTTAHEYVFLLTKSARYYYDADAIREAPISIGLPAAEDLRGQGFHDHSRDLEEGQRFDGGSTQRKAVPVAGRNKRSVWEIATQPFGLEMCASCKTIYTPAQYRRLRGGSHPRCSHEVVEGEPCASTNWLAQDGGALCLSCETFYTAKQLERLPRAAKCRKCGSEEWLSHFAVFPERLVEPCILAGTSERGCCPDCGAPWERVVEKSRTFQSGSGQAGTMPVGKNGPDIQGGGETLDVRRGPVVHTNTIGWRPTCDHEADPVPCVALDPFAGSGTVGVVTERLGRHSVLIDAKDEYCEMARHRTAQRGLMVEAAS